MAEDANRGGFEGPIGLAVDFDGLVDFGRKSPTANIVNGMPWSFEYHGAHVTHETDDHYIVDDGERGDVHLRRGQIMVTDRRGSFHVFGPVGASNSNEDAKAWTELLYAAMSAEAVIRNIHAQGVDVEGLSVGALRKLSDAIEKTRVLRPFEGTSPQGGSSVDTDLAIAELLAARTACKGSLNVTAQHHIEAAIRVLASNEAPRSTEPSKDEGPTR